MNTIVRKSSLNGAGCRRGRLGAVDAQVAERIRMRRLMLSMSQGTLAKSLGVTFQQIRKYEQCENRVGASALFHLAQALDVSIDYFFQQNTYHNVHVCSNTIKNLSDMIECQTERSDLKTLIDNKVVLQLIGNYYRIKNVKTRAQLLTLIVSLDSTPVLAEP